jgi:deoxyadenosine/deoxycytidine kinase
MKWFVAVSGNIGSGKSTITTLLSERLGFYRDMPRWSFHLQVFFLSKRFQHHREITGAEGSVIQDRTIYEDAEIFARNLYLQGLMDERDFRNYSELFSTMMPFLQPPDLILYLRASVPTLLERIRRRARDYEQGIPPEYLSQLNERYEEWVGRVTLCPILTIDADHLDLGNLDALVEEMRASMPSLFPLTQR